MPEQPADALDAAHGGDAYGQRRQLRGPERGPAGGRDAGGVCGGGGDDGRGRNSPYTAALLSHLETPLEIGLLFRRVRAQVLAATNGAQRPHEYHSLVGEHYLTLATGAAVTVIAAVAADPPRVAPPETNVIQLHIVGLRELAEAGNAEAQNELGHRYEMGRGVAQDFGAAVALYRQAADRGNARGQGNLGAMYVNGTGVERDDEAALAWLRRAPGQGDARGQNGLGVMYRDGLGVVRTTGKPSCGSAARPRRATPEGRTTSVPWYATGRGVSRDDAEAVRWYRRAAEQGHALRQESRCSYRYKTRVSAQL